MNKLTLIYIATAVLILSCKVHNSRLENATGDDTATSNVEQNSQKEKIIETILNNDNSAFVDTFDYQQEEINTDAEFKAQAINLNAKAIELFSYVISEPFSEQSVSLDSALILLDKNRFLV